jgi:hypothetical protein
MTISFFKTISCIAIAALVPISVATAETLGSGEAMKGNGKVVITALQRKKGILTVKGHMECQMTCKEDTNLNFSFLLDSERGVKYHVIRDTSSNLLVSEALPDLKDGVKFWAKYTAPPAEVTSIDLYLNDVEPIEGLAIQDK